MRRLLVVNGVDGESGEVESEGMALVSIGLPVRNGAATVRNAISALLAQSFSDFELIVSDNASTDATEAVCRSFADPRIRYIRQAENIGAVANFLFVLRHARGEFFMWAGADDLWQPDFIAANLAKLRQCPQAVASISRVRMGSNDQARVGTTPLDCVRAFLAQPGDNSRCYSLFRRTALSAVGDIGDFTAFDWAVIISALKHGHFVRVERELMTRAADGASRNPDYGDQWLFLGRFTAWLLRHTPAEAARCVDLLTLHNLRFSRPWYALRQAMRRHRSGPARTLPLQSALGNP